MLPTNSTRFQLLDDGHTALVADQGPNREFSEALPGLRFWDADTDRVYDPLNGRRIRDYQVSPDGRWIAFEPAEDRRRVWLFDAVSGEITPLRMPNRVDWGKLHHFDFLPGGHAVYGEIDSDEPGPSLFVWKLPSRELAALPAGMQGLNGCTPDGRVLALSRQAPSGEGYDYIIWDLERSTKRAAFHAALHAHLEFAPDSRGVLACWPSGPPPWDEVQYWDMNGRERWTIQELLGGPFVAHNRVWPALHDNPVNGIISVGGNYYGSAVRFYDLTTGQVSRQLHVNPSELYQETSPDGSLVAVQTTYHDDGGLVFQALDFVHLGGLVPRGEIYELDLRSGSTGRPLGRLPLRGLQYTVQFSPDGQTLAVYHTDGNTLTIWDVLPRKSRSWFAAAAGLLALPAALVAWLRVRQLRRPARFVSGRAP